MFKSARVQLTLIYTLIIMCISFLFSTSIYKISTIEINRVESRLRTRESIGKLIYPDLAVPIPRYNQEIIEEAKSRLIMRLLAINLIILFSSSGLSYWLSSRTLEPIQNVLESQKIFISDASHELKTPIASIKTGLEVYLRSKNKKLTTANILIHDTLQDINHLDGLTRQLLLLNTTAIQRKTLSNPVDTLDTLIKKLQPLLSQKNISINKDFTSQKNKFNIQAFEQVATIIIDNAIKFSSNNSSVNITYKNKVLKVADFGPGISSASLPFIFDRFYQSDLARNKSTNTGFGLGLSIAKQLCDQNNWQISCRSKVGSGTTFQVTLI